MGTDFNGDGRDDILWRDDFLANYTTWLAKADGGFIQNLGLQSKFVLGVWLVWGTGDFNGDGRDDILWRNNNGIVTNWLGTADSAFINNHANSVAAMPTDFNVAGVGDFNGDGRDDILWRNNAGVVTDWLSTPSGGFVDNKDVLTTAIPGDWNVAGVGDFNGDGRDDILWRHDGGMVTSWLGTADGGFVNNHENSATIVPNDWIIAGTGDFNGDGRDDVLWRHQSGLIETWLGTAKGGFANNHANSVFAPNTLDWPVLQIGDFNGDGKDDILWGVFPSITNWLGTSDGSFVSNDLAALTQVPPDWFVQPFPSGDGWI